MSRPERAVLVAPGDGPDSDGMWGVTAGLPEQVADAAAAAASVGGLPVGDGITNVVAFGMGGSGISGDVLAAIAGPLLGVPVVVSKDYACPAFVGSGSLVIASSHSGNTEETLAATAEAAERGARLVCVTAGGELARLATELGSPVVPLPVVPWPRAAFGALAVAPLVILERMGLLGGMTTEIGRTVEQLGRRRDRIIAALGTGGDETATLARRIGRTIPLVHGAGALGAAAAWRWKCQMNENVKCPAFASTQPELCHNEVTGWGQHGDATRQLITLVMLRHAFEHPQVVRRFSFVAGLLDEVVASIVEVRAEGEGPLAQMFDLVLVGDFVSLHLAANEGIDPGPIPVLTDLKAALASAP
jgi:glucose/mannose-6-phosphate isomerase